MNTLPCCIALALQQGVHLPDDEFACHDHGNRRVMNHLNELFDLIKQGKIEGFSTKPRYVETVISRVFIFDDEDRVLKFYKRDNEWWNSEMKDISAGQSRIDFIREDYEFNQFLNPRIYIGLKKAVIRDSVVYLEEANQEDDELVIVMHKEDLSGTFTQVLAGGALNHETYEMIGKQFASIKCSIPSQYLSNAEKNWHEQMCARVNDLSSWTISEQLFPSHLAEKGIAYMRRLLETHRDEFSSVRKEDLSVLIDCNSENLLFVDGELRFIDAYSPKDAWRVGSFDIDIFRVASDIYAMSGKEAYDAFLRGVESVEGVRLNPTLHRFHLLYGALIMGPYFYMLSRKDQTYLTHAEKYNQFIEEILTEIEEVD